MVYSKPMMSFNEIDPANVKADLPAPWHLTGDGFILVYHLPRPFLRQIIGADLASHFASGPSVVMLVNYHHSNAGPYQEVLFIPGLFAYQNRRLSSITRIYVSTWASVVNGQRNWAIPKGQADFAWQTTSSNHEQVSVSQNGHEFARFNLQALGPAALVSSSLIPLNWRTLWQPTENGPLFTQPQGRGLVKLAKVREAAVDPAYFPDLNRGRLLAAFKVNRFKLTFPLAQIAL
jgi:hypothetical protein